MDTLFSILFITVACVIPFVGFILIFAIIGTRIKLRQAKQIQKAIDYGAYKDFNEPKEKTKLRWIGLLGIASAFTLLAALFLLVVAIYGVSPANESIKKLLFISTTLLFVFCVIAGSGASILFQREIKHRL